MLSARRKIRMLRLLAFLQSTYEAAANAAKWNRDALECAPGKPGIVREIE